MRCNTTATYCTVHMIGGDKDTMIYVPVPYCYQVHRILSHIRLFQHIHTNDSKDNARLGVRARGGGGRARQPANKHNNDPFRASNRGSDLTYCSITSTVKVLTTSTVRPPQPISFLCPVESSGSGEQYKRDDDNTKEDGVYPRTTRQEEVCSED
jgi:hypothetical protein